MWPEFVDDGLNPQHEELVSQMNPELKAGLRIIKKNTYWTWQNCGCL